MSVVASWDFANRRIHMGVADWHPADIYREYRAYRAANEACRVFAPLLSYQGNLPKGGGKFTPRYMVLLGGCKIIPLDGATTPVTNITGEVITDDQSEPLTYTGLSVRPLVNYAPPSAEVIQVATSGSVLTKEEIADAVWSHSTATTLESRAQVAAAILQNKTITDPTTGRMTVYDTNGTTVLFTAQLYENVAGTQTYRGQGADRRERLA